MNDITCFGSRSIFYLTLHDLRGNKTYEGGATYPVRYTYDVFGYKTSMTTYRDEASGVGDTTIWAYDEASGVLLAKTYADGKGLAYTYTNDGRLATRTNARGIVTTYTYDDWGQLLAIDYADDTPDIAYTYDAMGRQTSATDAAGTTTFDYDAFGQLLSEQVSGLYSKTLTRHYDAFGRTVGYTVDGDRKQSITYDSATGRISESDGFRWTYLPGTNLKSSLTYPNEDVVTWTYEPHRNLLTAVTNATYSTYVYTNDLLGRRTSKNDEQYSYNVRDELISADDTSYAYDDIGNRTIAEGKTYTANNLNQYTAIDDFTPQYDADGNQTRIKTETGIWSVIYNAENRPIRWQSGDTVITMSFDRMGRRVEMHTVKDGAETLQHFVYDNYLCIQQLRGTDNALFQSYVWDSTEPIATRPLVFLSTSGETAYYFHDGNKNVADFIPTSGPLIHYTYTPFGTPVVATHSENPIGFSSEFYDNRLALVYYNYRYYNPIDGRWNERDPFFAIESVGNELYFLGNSPLFTTDVLGLFGDGYEDVCVEWKWKIVELDGRTGLTYVCERWERRPTPYMGHAQLYNNGTECPFDYTAEDSGWSSPFNPFSTWRHFRDKNDVASDLDAAIQSCNPKDFESYMHQYQDHETHYGKGYRWWLGGHIFAGTSPDEDEAAWIRAQKGTREYVDKWNANCCLACPKSKCEWVPKIL